MIARHTRSAVRPAKTKLAMFVAVACAVGVQAQAADEGPTSPTDTAPLDEIVVTARLRNERVQEVPDTIAVLSTDFMVRNQVETLKDVTLLLPNVGISESLSPGSSFINIRG